MVQSEGLVGTEELQAPQERFSDLGTVFGEVHLHEFGQSSGGVEGGDEAEGAEKPRSRRRSSSDLRGLGSPDDEPRVQVQPPPETIPVEHRLKLPDVHDWPNFNPCIFRDKVLVRTASYLLHDDGTITLKGDLYTRNYILTYHPNGWEVDEFKPEDHLLWKNGLEDGRVFRWEGRDWILFSACHQTEKSKWKVVSRNTMVLMDLETQKWVPLHTDQMREKNWMPIPGKDLFFLYSVTPWVVLAKNAEIVKKSPGPGTNWSGGTCFVPYGNQWIGVVHRRSAPGIYHHAFVLMDDDLSFSKISKPFIFHKEQIEFCAGLDVQGNDFVLSYGVMDREAWIVKVSRETVKGLF